MQRPASLRSLLPHPQRRNKRLLRDAHIAILAHPCLALFLFFQQLFLARDVAAVAFGGDVLAQRGDGFAGDDLAADRGLRFITFYAYLIYIVYAYRCVV